MQKGRLRHVVQPDPYLETNERLSIVQNPNKHGDNQIGSPQDVQLK